MSDDDGDTATATAADPFPAHAPPGPQSRRLTADEARLRALVRAITVRIVLALLREPRAR